MKYKKTFNYTLKVLDYMDYNIALLICYNRFHTFLYRYFFKLVRSLQLHVDVFYKLCKIVTFVSILYLYRLILTKN